MTSTIPKTKTMPVKSEPAEVDKIYTLDDVDPVGTYFEGLFFGPFGSGKTVAWSALPGPFRVIDADGGIKSLHWAIKEGIASIPNGSAEHIQAYRPLEDFDEKTHYVKASAFDRMCDMVDYWFSEEQVDKWEGGTLVYDSFSEVNDWAISKGLELNAKLPTPNKPLSGSHKINLQAETRLIVGMQDYKSAQQLVWDHLVETRVNCAKHKRNLIVVCHEWVDEERDDKGNRRVVEYLPSLVGNMRTRLPKEFDDVWYFHMLTKADGPEVQIQVHKTPTIRCKSRWGAFLKTMQKGTYRDIVKQVEEYHKK